MAYLFWVHFCFVFFVLQVSQTGSNDDQCLFVVLFFGFKNCVVFLLMQIVSFLSITIRKNSCPDQIKKGFLFVSVFCSIESEGDDANIFVSVFCFYLFDYFGSSKLIFTWLKTSRLLWQLWKGVQSTRTAVLSQIVFWMNNLMMKFKSFCLLDAYCGRGSTHSVTHAHLRAGHLR